MDNKKGNLNDFLERFAPQEESKPSQPCTKKRAKDLVNKRMAKAVHQKNGRWVRKYTKSECDVLKAIIDSIPIGTRNWHEVDITGKDYFSAAPIERLADKATVRWQTAQQAIIKLKANGFIEALPDRGQKFNQELFRVNVKAMENIQVGARPEVDRTEYMHEYYLRTRKKVENGNV